jgi:hypothetical protein
MPPIDADGTALAAEPVDEAEAAMRRALGLLGGSPRQRHQPERAEAPARLPERFGASGLHRRRFVQDGDVPVTVLRREPGQDATASRTGSAIAVPTTSRLQQLETALANETAGRAQAERALANAQVALHDLQTKIGHADLARNEGEVALRHERDIIAGLREELEAVRVDAEVACLRAVEAERRVADHEAVIAEERQARRLLQQSLQAAKAAGDEAERRLQTFSATVSEPVAQASHADEAMSAPKISPIKKRGRQAIVHQPTLPQIEAEPEPVKWWLTQPRAATRRC